MKIQKIFSLPFVAILVLSACGPTPTVIPATLSSNSTQSGIATAPAIGVDTAVIEASPTVESAPTVAGAMGLQITSPQDGDIVNTPQVDVIGTALAGTVVSVNDDILVLGEDHQFKSTISLDEGPNLIEVVASDNNGNETSVILTVTYEP